jgi:hypothetical protein
MDMDSFWSKQLVLLMMMMISGFTRMLTIVLDDIHNTNQHLELFIYQIGSFGKPFIQSSGIYFCCLYQRGKSLVLGGYHKWHQTPASQLSGWLFNFTTAVLTNNKKIYLSIYLFIYYKGTCSDIFKPPFSEKYRNNEGTNQNPMVLSWKLQVI